MSKEKWYWLAEGLGWGAVNSGEVLAAHPGGAQQIYTELGSEKLDELLTQKQADRLAALRPADLALRLHQMESQGIQIITLGDEQYPSTLRTIHNPPIVLFVKGDASLFNGQLSIGIVGARRPSAYGVEAVKAIGRGIALGGAIIVSGLAAGLDTEAHKAALAVNGPTIACIAFGHNHCYPAANRKLMEVIARYGAVISEYPPDISPEKPYFLQRNRIIAGMSHGLVVVEARRHSGTMSTVNFAVDFGRDVFGVPGSIFSELSGGTNAMIREGAYVASSASDVLSVYGVELKVEDPVAAAAKQSAEGRPAPASATPPWQQSISRYETERTITREDSEPLPGQQSLGELLRSQLKNTTGEVSAAQAVEAFRTLQKQLPAATESELDARNRALDEMVEAVSDRVQISDKARQKAAQVKPGQPQPFPWHQVERLDKNEIEDLSPAKGKHYRRKKKQGEAEGIPPAKRKLSVPAQQGNQPAGKNSFTGFLKQMGDAGAVTATGPIEPVSRIERLAPVTPVAQVAPLAGVHAAASLAPTAPAVAPMTAAPVAASVSDTVAPARQTPSREFVPKPVAERPIEKPQRDAALSGRLRTLQTGPEKPPALSKRADAFTPSQRPRKESPTLVDSHSLLSEVAQKALAQLGPNPVPLTDICQNSGLSPAQAMAALTELELAGFSRQLPGRQFVIAP